MSIKQIKLTPTHTRGTQLVSLLDLWSERKLVLLKRTQLHHVHQRESHDLKLQQITVGSVRNKADETHYGSNLQKSQSKVKGCTQFEENVYGSMPFFNYCLKL